MCRNAPSVSHLLFADDSLILMKADVLNAASLQHVLDTYCHSSGQMVSLPKSSVFFSPNTPATSRTEICQELHIERIKERLKGWMEKQLSIGGKEILIKAVAQAIPVFAMSVFSLPKGVCKDITDLIAQFWWGDDEDHKRMH